MQVLLKLNFVYIAQELTRGKQIDNLSLRKAIFILESKPQRDFDFELTCSVMLISMDILASTVLNTVSLYRNKACFQRVGNTYLCISNSTFCVYRC
jgi:hypothetical protein